jgi:8-hydroxy-5-deazaflavin:NADPH oxidoreductase
MITNLERIKIGLIGGTGKEGFGLATRWVMSGFSVIIGSRSSEKAEMTAEKIRKDFSDAKIQGLSNEQTAERSDIIVITIPYSSHFEMLNKLKPFIKNKLVIDVTVPLVPPKVSVVQMPPDGSAAQEAFKILGPTSNLAAAFHNISSTNLSSDSISADCDVLVTGTSSDARSTALLLVKSAGFKGWDAGPIENSSVLEGLTSVLIWINKKYGSNHAGIRITGVD